MKRFDENYCIETFKRLLAVDSTTGQYEEIQQLACDICDELGYPWQTIHKGGVIADLGGEGEPLVIAAHLDDIGLMVRHVNADGTLNLCMVGGLHPLYSVMENVRVYNRDGKVFTGCVCRTPNSIHVGGDELKGQLGDYDKNVCVVLDEDVHSAADTYALGIETGDVVALVPRPEFSNGYIKSRFVDDKACAAVLLTFMKALKDDGIALGRKVHAYFSMYEEIGHGTTVLPEGIRDIVSMDIAPTGPRQTSDEHKVTIFAKDSRFPYHWGLTNELRAAARKNGVDYVMDIFTPSYGTDSDPTVLAGYDVRHAAFGPGTSNSHGYERTHVDALKNCYDLLAAYLA